VEKLTGEFLIFLATVDPVSTLALSVGLTASASVQERTKIALRSSVHQMSTAVLRFGGWIVV
jgi:small neutral amino acid transporter SnatA (MarC family)